LEEVDVAAVAVAGFERVELSVDFLFEDCVDVVCVAAAVATFLES
jgi:hypothetical protein